MIDVEPSAADMWREAQQAERDELLASMPDTEGQMLDDLALIRALERDAENPDPQFVRFPSTPWGDNSPYVEPPF